MILLSEALVGPREWAWRATAGLGEGARGPGYEPQELSSADLAAPRRQPRWRIGATAALSSSPSSRRRRVFSPRGLEG